MRHSFRVPVVCLVVAWSAACAREVEPPDAGHPGQSDGGTTTVTLGPKAQRLLDEVAKLRSNQSADVDGDGTSEYQVTVVAGVVEWKVDYFGLGVVYRRRYDPGSETAESWIDTGLDGFAEIKTTVEPNKRTILKDTYDEKAYDWRRTDTDDWAARTRRTVIERTDADGRFVLVSDTTTSLRKAAGCPKPTPPIPGAAPPTCETFPAGGPNQMIGRNIGIYTSGSESEGADGACSSAHAERLRRAFDCALQRTLGCLKTTNNEEYRRLVEALHSGSFHMSCGNHCKGELAANSERETEVMRHSDMNFNPASLDSSTDDQACAVMLHEVMHWAGSPNAGDDHDAGEDLVHSCGRYCGGSAGCTYWDGNTPKDCGITPVRDCAACAGTTTEKVLCGLKEQWLEAEAGDPPPYGPRMGKFKSLCRKNAALGLYEDCAVLGQYDVACDGSKLHSNTVNPCCPSCPGDTVNEFACAPGVSGGALVETCIMGTCFPTLDSCSTPRADLCK